MEIVRKDDRHQEKAMSSDNQIQSTHLFQINFTTGESWVSWIINVFFSVGKGGLSLRDQKSGDTDYNYRMEKKVLLVIDLDNVNVLTKA